jgi:hypothetical protein
MQVVRAQIAQHDPSERDVSAGLDVFLRPASFISAHLRARVVAASSPDCMQTLALENGLCIEADQIVVSHTGIDQYRFDLGDLDGGRTDGAADEYAEVLTVKGDDTIPGATIVGKDAGEQIAPVMLMMTQRSGLGDVTSPVLPYPTRSEYVRRIPDSFTRKRLSPLAAASLRWWPARTR